MDEDGELGAETPFMFRVWYESFCQCVALGEYYRAMNCLAQMDLHAKTELTVVIVLASYEIIMDAMKGDLGHAEPSEN